MLNWRTGGSPHRAQQSGLSGFAPAGLGPKSGDVGIELRVPCDQVIGPQARCIGIFSYREMHFGAEALDAPQAMEGVVMVFGIAGERGWPVRALPQSIPQ